MIKPIFTYFCPLNLELVLDSILNQVFFTYFYRYWIWYESLTCIFKQAYDAIYVGTFDACT